MATAEPAARPHDRNKGRRPFTNWMKRLASLKNAATPSPHNTEKKTHHNHSLARARKHWNTKNNPYPESGYLQKPPPASTASARASSFSPGSERISSFASYEDSASTHNAPLRSNKSTAPTLATNAETIHSDAGRSKATAGTTGDFYEGRANSTFSSPQHSQESLTTTLTTIQSTAPSALLTAQTSALATQSPVQFSHQYPISPPASAVPSHLQPSPHTYMAATANGMLNDDASIMTLASSSKRRRRGSLDTDASVRALAPSSLWGNSRESLPLSVLSSNIDNAGSINQSQNRPSVSGFTGTERASVYSASGVGAPALISERNSYYSAKQGIDTTSIRSGLFGHGRTDSINGSITGLASSPLASPRDTELPGRSSRRTSEWKDGDAISTRESVREDSEENDKSNDAEKDIAMQGK